MAVKGQFEKRDEVNPDGQETYEVGGLALTEGNITELQRLAQNAPEHWSQSRVNRALGGIARTLSNYNRSGSDSDD